MRAPRPGMRQQFVRERANFVSFLTAQRGVLVDREFEALEGNFGQAALAGNKNKSYKTYIPEREGLD